MQWQGRRQSSNVEDARGSGGGRRSGAMIGGGLGGGGLILLLILTLLTGRNPLSFIGGGDPQPQVNQNGTYVESAQEKERREFLSVVLADTEDAWSGIFKSIGKTYQPPKMVIFKGSVRSGCGSASAQMGPFYCSVDRKVYIDSDFFDQMERDLGAGGDFAMAYVLAHEVGHHVQQELGILDSVHKAQSTASEKQRNDLTVRLELQADYLAGVWAHYAQNIGILEQGDIEEAMRATNAIGDDTLQKEAQGYVVPDSFTHGTSEQRTRWFMKGFKAGDLTDYDTFSVSSSSKLEMPNQESFWFLRPDLFTTPIWRKTTI